MPKIVELLRSLYPEDELLDDTSDAYDFMFVHGAPEQFVLMYRLFFPELEEVEGSILAKNLKYEDSSEFIELKKQEKYTVGALERIYNMIELNDMFVSKTTENSDDEKIADLIRHAWAMHLKTQYPSRNFKVSVLSPDETGAGIGVEFYEIR